jgi:hypothetical protein
MVFKRRHRRDHPLPLCKTQPPSRNSLLIPNHAGTLIVDSYSPELWENTFLLTGPTNLRYLVMTGQDDSDTYPYCYS